MDEPLVSVVIPSYNRAHVIAETLESVLAQTWPRQEIIVVDDGSKDDTEKAVAPYRDRITYIKKQNAGLAAARNTGMSRANGEYIAWLDSDDLWNPEKLALQMAAMQQHPDNVLVASDFSAFDEDGFHEASHVASYYAAVARLGLRGIFPESMELPTQGLPHVPAGLPPTVRVYSGNIWDKLIGGNCLHPPTVLFKRDAAHRAGGLDKHFRKDSDYEYLLRLSREGRVAFVDRPLMRYRYSPDQMSSDKFLADIAISRVLVLESLLVREPYLAERRSFRRRLGRSHLAVASALSEVQRRPAARHLLFSLRWAYADGDTAKTIAKLLLPSSLRAYYRKRRRPRPGS